jgi:mono/diheme cytochrome c family protein
MKRVALAAFLLAASTAWADAPAPTFGSNFRFTEQGGAAIYGAVCAGCHMADGGGAMGAGTYPSLAKDERLAAVGYPIARVLRGNKAMPGFGRMLTDAQVADVVGFIRTHFGNAYPDGPAAADVAAAR